MFAKVYPREKYLSGIRPFFNSDLIKVITGIRRCGKSFLLRAIMNELLAGDTKESDIIYIPLDKRGFKNIKTPEQLEKQIDAMASDAGFKYLFIDEVQNVREFESVIQAYAEEGYSIF